ncbi:hypothetical protein RRG08_042539 [Elysia crispata]|uniref:Uncharacterized protein n=1 Tax=Elysia crispata TaxID=231223 RepID=A0AAE1CKB1_9GAST|nr:hypothetical protein RRG08_042539 [Elysia crispata]
MTTKKKHGEGEEKKKGWAETTGYRLTRVRRLEKSWPLNSLPSSGSHGFQIYSQRELMGGGLGTVTASGGGLSFFICYLFVA